MEPASTQPVSAPARNADFFTALGLPRRLTQDAAAMEERFYALSRQWHPDRFATADAKSRIASLEASALINRAYRALKEPWSRARYLVELEGGSPADAKPPRDLFEKILDLQDSLDDLRQAMVENEASEKLGARVHTLARPFREALAATDNRLNDLSRAWDALADGDQTGRQNVIAALAALLGERRYIERMVDDVDAALQGKPAPRQHR